MSKAKLPNGDRAFIDMRKLRDYALDPDHRVGKHKARLFVALLDMGKDDADALREILLQAVQTNDAIIGIQDEHGQRYSVDFKLAWHGREALVRSAWNIRPYEDFPRLISCYPLEEVQDEQ